jgi:YfiH family protein
LLHISNENLIIPYQTHQTEIKVIDEHFFRLTSNQKKKHLHGVDGLITQLSGVCIGITTFDCVPLLFFDPVQKVIAASHAGWRGTCARISAKTVQKLVEKFNSNPSDICVAIGPSISQKVYEVGKEVVESFANAGFDINEIVTVRNNSFFLDLWKANHIQLQQSGISDQHIEIAGICTYTEHERFFSARRLGIQSGRMLSGIILNN